MDNNVSITNNNIKKSENIFINNSYTEKSMLIDVKQDFNWAQDLSQYKGYTFIIKYEYNLTGINVFLPLKCTLDFSYGGSFLNGTIVSPSEDENEIITIIIPEHKNNIMKYSKFSGGYFYAKNPLYITSILGESQVDYEYVYCKEYRNVLKHFINSHIIYNISYYPKTVEKNLTIGKGNIISGTSNGICAPFALKVILQENVIFKNLTYLSPTVDELYANNGNCVFDNVTFINTRLNLNSNYNRVKNCKFTPNLVDASLVIWCISMYNASFNHIEDNIFSCETSKLPQFRSIVLKSNCNYNIIENNEITGGITGISLMPQDDIIPFHGSIIGNVIKHNTIHQVTEEAISLDSLLGSERVALNAFTIKSILSAYQADIEFEVDDPNIESYSTYIAFGLNDKNHGKFSEILTVTKKNDSKKNGFTIFLKSPIFNSDFIESRFGICFGFLGNMILENIIYQGHLALHGLNFNTIISQNISFYPSYMAIYVIGGKNGLKYGNCYNAPIINVILTNNIVPYGGLLIASKVQNDGSNGYISDSTITKYQNLYAVVKNNICGMYINSYGFYFSTIESCGNEYNSNLHILKNNSTNYIMHDIQYTNYIESPDKNNLIKNSGNRILYLNDDGSLSLYDGKWITERTITKE